MRACCGGYGAPATHPAQVVTSGSPGDDEWHCVPARPRPRLQLPRGAVLPLLSAARPPATPTAPAHATGAPPPPPPPSLPLPAHTQPPQPHPPQPPTPLRTTPLP